MKEKDLGLNLETENNKPILKDITIRIKYYPNGVPSTELTCDFCKEPIEVSFIPKTRHFVLCERCKTNFNSKIREGMSVLESSSSIGIFRKNV